MSEDERAYSEEEFALILRKAAELVEPRETKRGGGSITLSEMKSIAAEVGLDPDAVERAAALVERAPGTTTLDRVLGSPVKQRLEYLTREPLTEAAAAHALIAIRAAVEQHGKGDALHGSLSWHSEQDPSRIYVTAQPDGAGTRVKVTVDRSGGVVFTTMASVALTFALGFFLYDLIDPVSELAELGVLAASIVSGLGFGRMIWVSTGRRLRAKAERVMKAVTGSMAIGPVRGPPDVTSHPPPPSDPDHAGGAPREAP